MTIEIKTSTLEPVRNTYEHIKRRFGDKPASRYQEASYDVAPTHNFHYRPYWEPDRELNDPRRTAIVMQDWYAHRDPRQYYYGAYVQARAKLQEITEANYAFFDKRGLGERMDEAVRARVIRCLVPLRHAELGANMNNVFSSAYGVATVITQAFLYNGMDRLGIAQYLSRIGLLLDGNSGASLASAKEYWMTDPVWQGMRRYIENVLVLKDWFEVFIAQDVVLDTLVYDLMYRQFDEVLTELDGGDIAMLTEFMKEWHKDTSRWVDAVMKTCIAESDHNRETIGSWVQDWREKAVTDLSPLAEIAVGEGALNESVDILNKRLAKVGLNS
ncbi:MAG: phenol hydroxylase [Halioglobus sp.]|nr:phenol hydroxylase [Halioglobus sp.]|tara:strand:- start:427 stop:1413 length:987 start_codon:yes stop_codon:yes gene_type:complete